VFVTGILASPWTPWFHVEPFRRRVIREDACMRRAASGSPRGMAMTERVADQWATQGQPGLVAEETSVFGSKVRLR